MVLSVLFKVEPEAEIDPERLTRPTAALKHKFHDKGLPAPPFSQPMVLTGRRWVTSIYLWRITELSSPQPCNSFLAERVAYVSKDI